MKANKIVCQALCMSVNYVRTGRLNKAIEVVSQINKAVTNEPTANIIMNWIASGNPKCPESIEEEFGKYWSGEPLDEKFIEVICDQGMGDTINCLRYLKQIKSKWKCKIVLNCFAFYKEFKNLMAITDCVDLFTDEHYSCPYSVNILSIPNILNGFFAESNYPAHWQQLLDTKIPEQPLFKIKPKEFKEQAFRVGIASHSNLDNPLGVKKSISLQEFAILEDGINELWSLIPDQERTNIMAQPELPDMLTTAAWISAMDVVVSVDTAVLHLAGTLGKKTLGLLPAEADARWGLGRTTPWYSSVELFREPKESDPAIIVSSSNRHWDIPMRQVKTRLESLRLLS